MSSDKQKGRGKLVPAQQTGLEYQVDYGIHFVEEVRQHGRTSTTVARSRWMKCMVRSVHAHLIPNGNYFLHMDNGRVIQIKSDSGKWEYLAMA